VAAKNGLKTKIETHRHEDRVASAKQTRGGEFIWSEDRCTGCDKCARICPVDAIKIAYKPVIVKRLGTAPCSQACPAGIDVPRYVRLIGEGKYPEAVAVIREKIPFPSVCGYICLHPCEAKCQRGAKDDPILIRVLKRFAADRDSGLWKQGVKKAKATKKKVAIVGSGPAGLTAGYYLTRLGHQVTVFEAMSEVGGAMRVYIPDYRLPKAILDADIKEITDAGVTIKTNTKIDSINKLKKEGYDAILLAIGAHQGVKMGIEGEDSPGVKDCITFLKEVSRNKKMELGTKVAVIGGGNAAVDAARTVRRLGVKDVSIIYRRSRAEMPASPEEVNDALAEGVHIQYLAAPSKVVSRDGKVDLVLTRMHLGEVDASGRRRPEPIKGSQFTKSFDTVIAAIGQQPSLPEELDIATGRGNTVSVDPETMATGKEGVFAAGDAVLGPASVIDAIATGRRAAKSIDKFLGGSGDISEVLSPSADEEGVVPLKDASGGGRIEVPRLAISKRLDSFELDEGGLSEKEAVREARRCLKCDLSYLVDSYEVDTSVCTYCGRCFEECIWDALSTGYGYEKAAKERKEQLEAQQKSGKVYEAALTLLVAAVTVIVLSQVVVKLF
jgi:NADPH-dependent glutamate synthase beta subunit-like oxidoreductase/NAD-dependent dihydropyrimidine dehydrogenase PreA subunit